MTTESNFVESKESDPKSFFCEECNAYYPIRMLADHNKKHTIIISEDSNHGKRK